MIAAGNLPVFCLLQKCTGLHSLLLDVDQRMVKLFCAERGAQWPATLKNLSIRHIHHFAWPHTKGETIRFVNWMFDILPSIGALDFFSVHGFYPWLEKTDVPLRLVNTPRLELPLGVAQFLAGNSPVRSLDLSQTWYSWEGNLGKFPERLPAVEEVAVRIPDLRDYRDALKEFLRRVPNASKLVLNWSTEDKISVNLLILLNGVLSATLTLDVSLK
jgi:hypothetical protein